MPIGYIGDECRFYYQLPVSKTLGRLIRDNTLREHIIGMPTFTKNNTVYESFSDGSIIQTLDIKGNIACGVLSTKIQKLVKH